MTAGARRAVNVVMSWLAAAAAGLVVLPLLLILAFLLWQGVSAVNVDFFTHLPRPVGEVGGGMANAIVGTLILLVLAAALGLPVGILGGLYLAESRDRRLPWIARFLADVLNGVPSIVIGIFAYTIIVLPMRRFSALAGGFALAVIMLPIVVRTSEELVRLVPASLREAALALGIPQWKVLLRVVLPTARAGIITGVMVALARVAGETAPIMFTAAYALRDEMPWQVQHWTDFFFQGVMALPYHIYVVSSKIPQNEYTEQMQYGAAFILLLLVFFIALASIILREKARKRLSW